jgi:hypothetical protein
MRPYVHPRSSTPPRIALRTDQEREGSRRDMGGLKSMYKALFTTSSNVGEAYLSPPGYTMSNCGLPTASNNASNKQIPDSTDEGSTSTSSTSWCVYRDVGTLGSGVSRDTIACMVWDSAGDLGHALSMMSASSRCVWACARVLSCTADIERLRRQAGVRLHDTIPSH